MTLVEWLVVAPGMLGAVVCAGIVFWGHSQHARIEAEYRGKK